MRTLILAPTIAIIVATTAMLGGAIAPVHTIVSPCEMNPDFNASAQAFLRGFLLDTAGFDDTRNELGINGVTYSQVVIVRDSVQCRKAISAWQKFYATLGSEIGARAALHNNGRLFRITPNRFILATPLLNPYSFLTYIALDSNFVVVRKNL